MDNIKEILMNDKEAYQIFSQAFIQSVATAVYSEFLHRMKNVMKPVQCVHIPELKFVRELCDHVGPLMNAVAENLTNQMHNNSKYPLIPGYIRDVIESDNFTTILYEYLLPIIEVRLPDSISNKFQLDTDQQTFKEDRTIDLFDREFGTDWQVKYIADETVLQCIFLSEPSVDAPANLNIDNDTLLWINNNNALSPIVIDPSIIENEKMWEVISFVTGTEAIKIDTGYTIYTYEHNVVKLIH